MRAADFETHLIRHLDIAPKAVAFSVATGPDDVQVALNGDPQFGALVEETLRDTSVWVNAPFDMSVVCFNRPDYVPLVAAAYMEGRVLDCKLLEKLITIADQGNMRFRRLPDGRTLPIVYDLTSMEQRWLKRDRHLDKGERNNAVAKAVKAGEGVGDSYRHNFAAFDGWKASELPADALAYVEEDALSPLQILRYQQVELDRLYIRQTGKPFNWEIHQLHAACEWVLYMTSAQGIHIDLEAVEELRAYVQTKLCDDALPLLLASGIMRPTQPERPGAQKIHVENCHKKKCGCPPKPVKAKKSSICTANLHALIEQICEEHDKPVVETDTGRTSAAADVLEELKGLNETLDEYIERQAYTKLESTEIPRMSAPVIHFGFDGCKVTGRISCSAMESIPSGNLTNVDPRARQCYVPPPADNESEWVICSIDYSGMELVTLAQRVYNLFGQSSHRDYLNAGVDLHGFLGANIAFNTNADFRDYAKQLGANSHATIYDAFAPLKKDADESPTKLFFAEQRNLAKPTGLGYPGGLGPETFIAFAKANYGIKVDLHTATRLRDIWYEVHPDMHEYFSYFKANQRDMDNSRREMVKNKKTKELEEKFKQRYWYTSPLGMLRRGCSYTEGVNGMGLQTPGAELAKGGLLLSGLACMVPGNNEIVYGNARLMGFVHDECLFYVRLNKWMHEVCFELARLMVEGGKHTVPDVLLKAEPAVMRRWNKKAEKVLGPDGRLAIWEPTPKKEAA